MDEGVQRILEVTFDRLQSFENNTSERLSRMEENLRLLRESLLGDGQPGRIGWLETEVDQLRVEYHRQRGVLAAISFFVSVAIALISRMIHR